MSAPRRFKANLSELYEVVFDIIKSVESRGHQPPVSSFMLRLGKSTVVPNMVEYTSDEAFASDPKNVGLSKEKYAAARTSLKEIETKQYTLDEGQCTLMIEKFIIKSSAYWPQIKDKDVKFLIENASVLFAELPEQYIKGFCQLFDMSDKQGNPMVSEDRISEIWDFLHAMIRISIRHIHETRRPKEVEVISKDDNGENVKSKVVQYTQEYFPTLSVRNLVETWQVKIV